MGVELTSSLAGRALPAEFAAKRATPKVDPFGPAMSEVFGTAPGLSLECPLSARQYQAPWTMPGWSTTASGGAPTAKSGSPASFSPATTRFQSRGRGKDTVTPRFGD